MPVAVLVWIGVCAGGEMICSGPMAAWEVWRRERAAIADQLDSDLDMTLTQNFRMTESGARPVERLVRSLRHRRTGFRHSRILGLDAVGNGVSKKIQFFYFSHNKNSGGSISISRNGVRFPKRTP